jgi:hypothetical protein
MGRHRIALLCVLLFKHLVHTLNLDDLFYEGISILLRKYLSAREDEQCCNYQTSDHVSLLMRIVDEFYLGANEITIAYILNNTRKDSRLQWMFLVVEYSAAFE